MSKSLGNFFTIRTVVERYHPLALRLFLVSTQYRQAINFTQRALEEVGCLSEELALNVDQSPHVRSNVA